MDIFERIKENPGPLGQFADYGEGYFIFPRLEGPIGPRMKFQGKEVVFWSANDYLGMCNNSEVLEADAKAAAEYGMFYPMGARAMSGETDEHLALEKELADFVNKESAYVLNFGYQGMVSAIDALVSRHDVIVYDADSHACIVDGVRLHMGKSFTFRHNDMESLEKNLERATKVAEANGGGILVITEGVFGMRGMQGKIKEICELKKKFNFRLLVDDAHGFGTLGKTGAGVGEEQNCQEQIDVYFSTFAKSMAGFGAFLAGDAEIIRYLKFNLRSQIFAKSLTMPMVIGARKRLEILKSQPEIKAKLWENVHKLQNGLKDRGFNIGLTNTCVTPVMIEGTPVEATLLVKDLRENFGIFTSVVVYPVIPKGMILLRLIPTAAHTDEEINETLAAFEALHDKLVSGYYKDAAEKLLKEENLSFKPI
ncbi:aminotransferase class I/II-fold pyridoxal phosphate-dependent enzyme [Cruoricaptor ignavus]|uniref:Aminotransferase class I/II-fold pyridoxal phosphate-dependent enzyme n=1 Tax=Cruoricaptor ignavus TaxID=1118202 RepID=A0A7M1T4N0_9FLAO|nr:aminotransferase class I/II-fold pyridoxal phosphate-dependent enzyme [Cruoricaptor ignavus]QOR73842.1 aminotransferase class I/II-fold pyridoxal phosphate-dependent enzyme [Cruoricaptor ignavus]